MDAAESRPRRWDLSPRRKARCAVGALLAYDRGQPAAGVVAGQQRAAFASYDFSIVEEAQGTSVPQAPSAAPGEARIDTLRRSLTTTVHGVLAIAASATISTALAT